MNAFREHHENSIKASYRCFDRILLNRLIQPFQQPEAGDRFFQFLPSAISCQPKGSDRHCRSISVLGKEPIREMGGSDFGSTGRAPR